MNVCVCVCVCLHVSSCVSYPAYELHIFCTTLYFFGSCLVLSNFSDCLINGTIFEKKIENKVCVLIFPKIFLWNISYSRKNLAGYYNKYMLVFGERRDAEGTGTALQAGRSRVPFLMLPLEFFVGTIFLSASNRQPYQIFVAIVLKPGSLILLKPQGLSTPVQAFLYLHLIGLHVKYLLFLSDFNNT
jgi:hypothetical protein